MKKGDFILALVVMTLIFVNFFLFSEDEIFFQPTGRGSIVTNRVYILHGVFIMCMSIILSILPKLKKISSIATALVKKAEKTKMGVKSLYFGAAFIFLIGLYSFTVGLLEKGVPNP